MGITLDLDEVIIHHKGVGGNVRLSYPYCSQEIFHHLLLPSLAEMGIICFLYHRWDSAVPTDHVGIVNKHKLWVVFGQPHDQILEECYPSVFAGYWICQWGE